MVLVDNGSNDGTCKLAEAYCEKYGTQVHLLSLPKNCGTTYPRNLGLKKIQGLICCILDSDTEFIYGRINSILNLVNRDEIGMVVPQLVLPGNYIQDSVKKFPTFFDKIRKIPGIIFGMAVSKNDFYDAFPFSEPRAVDTAISACWFFKRSMLDVVGFLDEKFFYAPEDVEFCLRVNKASLQIVYYPQVSILHHTQQLSHKKPFSKVSWNHFAGLLYYFTKHGGWFKRPVFPHVSQ